MALGEQGKNDNIILSSLKELIPFQDNCYPCKKIRFNKFYLFFDKRH